MSARLSPIELAVDHVGDCRQRMPVVRNAMGERPGNPVQCEALRYLCVVDDVGIVVVINEFVSERLTKNHPRDHRQAETDPEDSRNVMRAGLVHIRRLGHASDLAHS
jgi:hypothetical protein